MKIKICSFNVAGIKGSVLKGLWEYIDKIDCDFVCFQEIKCYDIENELNKIMPEGKFKYAYANPCLEKKGYSGTLILTNKKAISHTISFCEGRIQQLEYENYNLINIYAPNSGPNLDRIDFKMDFFDELEKVIDTNKNNILVGDFNVAIDKQDLLFPDKNLRTAGFTIEERKRMVKFLENTGFKDTTDDHIFTYCSHLSKKKYPLGTWRIDYAFILFPALKDKKVKYTFEVHNTIKISDHFPIILKISI